MKKSIAFIFGLVAFISGIAIGYLMSKKENDFVHDDADTEDFCCDLEDCAGVDCDFCSECNGYDE